MKIVVAFSPQCTAAPRIRELVREVNQIQTYFRVEPHCAAWLPNDRNEQASVDSNRLHNLIRARRAQTPELRDAAIFAVTQSGLDPDWFADERGDVSVITVAGWESEFAPPPTHIYLMFQLASSMINFAAKLTVDQIQRWAHRPGIGCMFDWYRDVRELRRCMIAANVCGTCEIRLAEMGIPMPALMAIEQVLSFVRAAVIRRPRTVPSRVFIGHGHSPVWQDVRDIVQSMGLTTEEFNQEVAAGISTSERLQELLNASAFAILVTTGEDTYRTGRRTELRARENVVHEIGLFQGRLGFRRAIVLLEKGVAPFSNIRGLTYLSFTRGRLRTDQALRAELRRLFVREGLL